MKKLSAFLTALVLAASAALPAVNASAFEPAELLSATYIDYDDGHKYSILDTAELGSDGSIPCYDCSSSITSTKVLWTYKINDKDKKILQEFMDEHFTDDMTNTEKIQYTIDWLHNNMKYAITSAEFKSIEQKPLTECGFVMKLGQCLQYNGALAYMLEYMGYEANIIFLESGSWRHYTCQIRINGRVFGMEAGNKGLDDGSHYMPASMLDLETALNTDENTVIGECGKNAYFTFEKSTGRLIIDGMGEFAPYSSNSFWEEYKDEIKSLVIEDGITGIYGNVLNGCSNLSEVSIPDSVKYIQSGVFDDTPFIDDNDSDFVIIGDILYKYKGDASEITIPDGIKTVGSSVFQNNPTIEKVIIPDSVTTIEQYAFAYCKKLSDAYIPDSVVSIDGTSFDGTPFIMNQTSDFVTAGSYLYKYQGSDAEAVIPENITVIGSSAFARNEAVTSVVFPENLRVIQESAFMGCKGLTEIKLPDSIEKISSFAFSGCEGLTEVILPENLQFIPYGLFSDCPNLKKLTIPAGISKIEAYAFLNSDYDEEGNYETSYSIEEIDFTGSEAKWNQLVLGISLYEDWSDDIKVNFVIAPYSAGDVDGDRKVTAADALNVLQNVVGQCELTDKQKKAADLDCDNEITPVDALMILQIVVSNRDE